VTIRQLREGEWDAVARLIFESTNAWYEQNRHHGIFDGEPSVCRLFPEVYERLDRGCCLVAEEEGTLVGSCFHHPRETHVAVGIVNVDARRAGRGVARRLMEMVIEMAGGRPVRLVSSAMNLDSYSLYTRLGFAPVALFQDMVFGESADLGGLKGTTVREARMEDLEAMVALEEELVGIRRGKDFRFFIENAQGIWHGSVVDGAEGLDGFLFSVNDPGSRIAGPGVMRTTDAALSLIAAEAERFEGGSPLMLVPAAEKELVRALYAAGARNCELHVAQVRGEAQPLGGIVMPTFMPETG
jgi:ribosomal protein S18 acetylase RimI-like enzyme